MRRTPADIVNGRAASSIGKKDEISSAAPARTRPPNSHSTVEAFLLNHSIGTCGTQSQSSRSTICLPFLSLLIPIRNMPLLQRLYTYHDRFALLVFLLIHGNPQSAKSIPSPKIPCVRSAPLYVFLFLIAGCASAPPPVHLKPSRSPAAVTSTYLPML